MDWLSGSSGLKNQDCFGGLQSFDFGGETLVGWWLEDMIYKLWQLSDGFV